MMRPKRRRIMRVDRGAGQAEGRGQVDRRSPHPNPRPSIAQNRLSRVMPALATRISSWPIASSAAGTSASTAAGSARLQGSTWTRLAQLAGERVERLAARAGDGTVAPWPCRAWAIAPPMPPVAPVTERRLAGQIEHRRCLLYAQASADGLRSIDRRRRRRSRCRSTPSAMRLTSPLSTLPAPISTERADAGLRHVRRPTRASAPCRSPARPGGGGSRPDRVIGAASTLATSGTAGASDAHLRPAPPPSRRRRAASARNGTARTPAAASRAWRLWPWRSRPRARPPPCRRKPPPGRRRCRWRPGSTWPCAASRSDRRGHVEFEPEQRRHGAVAHRHGLLHRAAAHAQQPRRVGNAERCRPRPAPNIRRANGRRRRRRRVARSKPASPPAPAWRRARPPSAPAGRSRSACSVSAGPSNMMPVSFCAERRVDLVEDRARRRESCRRAPCPCRPPGCPDRET